MDHWLLQKDLFQNHVFHLIVLPLLSLAIWNGSGVFPLFSWHLHFWNYRRPVNWITAIIFLFLTLFYFEKISKDLGGGSNAQPWLSTRITWITWVFFVVVDTFPRAPFHILSVPGNTLDLDHWRYLRSNPAFATSSCVILAKWLYLFEPLIPCL